MKEYADMLREGRIRLKVNQMNDEQIKEILESNPYHREGFVPTCDCPECWGQEEVTE